MKRVLAILLTLVILAGLLAGCGSKKTVQPQGNEGEVSEVSYLKEYKSTFSSPITSMNPYTTSGTSDYVFISNLVEGLVETDRYGRPVPCIAES